MHHINHLASSHKVLHFVLFSNRVKLSHSYNTRANRKKRMEGLEQENAELREEVATLRDTLERLNSMIETMASAQNQPSQEEPQMTVISEIVSMPVCEVPTTDPRYIMPPNRPWGMPLNFTPEGYRPQVAEATANEHMPEGYRPLGIKAPRATIPEGYRPQVIEVPRVTSIMTMSQPVVHTVPQHKEKILPAVPSESAGVHERLNEFQEQFLEMQKELKTLQG